MSERPTPETDQFKVKLKTTCGEKYWVPVEHSERLERERDEACEKKYIHLDNFLFAQRDIFEMKEAIISTLEENRHLADGDDCMLAKLKSVVPDWK